MNIYLELIGKSIGIIALFFACQYYLWDKVKKLLAKFDHKLTTTQEKEVKCLVFSFIGTLMLGSYLLFLLASL